MKKIIPLILCFLMIISVCSIPALADNNIVASGKCGETEKDNVNWTLFDSGELIISGNGKMSNFSEQNEASWLKYSIGVITIKEGITSIGDYAFTQADGVYIIKMPKSLKSIGKLFYSSNKPDCDKTVISYAGSESEWNKVKKATDFQSEKHIKVYFNGTQPEPYCEFIAGDQVTVKANEPTILKYECYSAEKRIDFTRTKIEKADSVSIGEKKPGEITVYAHSIKETPLTLELCDVMGELIVSDTISVKTSFSEALKYNIKIAFSVIPAFAYLTSLFAMLMGLSVFSG
ncbi:MAG: hypothetical protein IJJ61_07290 [Clostridia bacterium]|nr:hypothetical protein [Clostridia bacterium]